MVGAARQQLAALDTQNDVCADQGTTSGLARRGAVLKELREAFGVNGIPAMIIEHTLPFSSWKPIACWNSSPVDECTCVSIRNARRNQEHPRDAGYSHQR